MGTFWQARPLPGRSDRVLATFAPHHGHPHGAIGLIDRNYGPEGERGKGFAYLTKGIRQVGDQQHEWAYRDPFPLSDETFLCAYGGGVERFRLFLADFAGNLRLLYDDPAAGCYFPLALRPVEPPARLSQRLAQPPATADATGVVLLTDVSHGLDPVIGRGRVAALRVMEQVRKTEDLAERAYDQSPVMSYGTYYAKRSCLPFQLPGCRRRTRSSRAKSFRLPSPLAAFRQQNGRCCILKRNHPIRPGGKIHNSADFACP